MDDLKGFFAGQKDTGILERAYRDAKGNLGPAIDLVLHADPKPSGTKAATLGSELQRGRKRQRLSMSAAEMPHRAPTVEQYRRRKAQAASPIAKPALPGAKKDLIVISDDEDASMDPDDGRPPGFVSMSLTPPAPAKSTPDECLSKALEVFPNISREYVLKLYNEAENTPDLPAKLILRILDDGAKYPKEAEVKRELKRKRQDDSDAAETNYEAADRENATPSYI